MKKMMMNNSIAWKQLKLGDCLVVKHGKPQREVEVANGQYPILATGGEIGRTNSAIYSKPSVLIGRKGTIDKPRYIDTPFWTVDTLFYTHIKDGFVPKYLFYKFQTINWKLYNESSGLPSLSASSISTIKVNIPPFPEQNRIVAVLETWDKAIEKLEKNIVINRQIKNGLMQQLLVGKKRLYGFSEKWESIRIGQLCDIKRGGSPRPINDYMTNELDALNWLKIGDVPKGNRYITRTTGKIRQEGLNMTTLVREDDFILSNSMSFGRPYIMKIAACIHDGWLALQNIDKNINKDFLYYLLQSDSVQSTFKSISAGSGVQNLKKETVSEMVLRIPSLKEQTEIAKILTTSDNELDLVKSKLKIITDQKKYLLNNLITGNIRTPENLLVN